MARKARTQFVYVKLWEPIQPMDRGDRYEDPLQEVLEAAHLGEVTGGGSMLSPEGEITYAGIDLELVNLDAALETCRKVLEEAGAPRGSEFQFNKTSVSFGVTEAVAVYLDGINLPREVYQQSDVNVLIEQLSDALGEEGELRHFWEGPANTALYLYGHEAERIYTRKRSTNHVLEPLVSACPGWARRPEWECTREVSVDGINCRCFERFRGSTRVV